jgi:hypothetical protein
MTKIAGSGSICQRHGSPDPDPHQNVLDPEDCTQALNTTMLMRTLLMAVLRLGNQNRLSLHNHRLIQAFHALEPLLQGFLLQQGLPLPNFNTTLRLICRRPLANVAQLGGQVTCSGGQEVQDSGRIGEDRASDTLGVGLVLWEVGSGWGLVHRSEAEAEGGAGKRVGPEAKMAGMDVGGHREHET